MSIFSEKQRGVVKKVTIEIEYPNGAKKIRSYNPQRDNIEGLFWSDRMVNDMLAPYYERQKLGHDMFQIMEMWDPIQAEWDHRPAMLVKGVNDRVLPVCNLYKDRDTIEEMIMLDRLIV